MRIRRGPTFQSMVVRVSAICMILSYMNTILTNTHTIINICHTAAKSGLQKRSINLCDDGSSDDVQQQPTKKQKSKAATNDDKKSAPFTITGLKYAEVSASVGEKVTLVREPENVSSSVSCSHVCNTRGQLAGET